MKQKEKWAQDWYVANDALNMEGEGVFSSTEAWIAGFDFAKEKILEIDWAYVSEKYWADGGSANEKEITMIRNLVNEHLTK